MPAASQGNCVPDRNCDTIHSVQAATMTPQSWELAWRGMPAKLRTSAQHLQLHETQKRRAAGRQKKTEEKAGGMHTGSMHCSWTDPGIKGAK